jgi:carboxymethylenebutenolidase
MRRIALMSCLFLAGCWAHTSVPAPEPAGGVEPVSYPAGKETAGGVLYRPPGKGPFPAVVVVHGDHGLTDGVKRHAEHLVQRGLVVLAVDLYRGELASDVEDAHILCRLSDDQVLADLRGAVGYLVERPDVRGEAVGILGWGTGGGQALDAAIADPRLRAAVICYGRLTTDPELLRPLRARVLGIFAGQDVGIDAQTIDRFRAAMTKAGKEVAGLHVYPECDQGFMGPDETGSPGSVDARAAVDAWNKIEAFLDRELGR